MDFTMNQFVKYETGAKVQARPNAIYSELLTRHEPLLSCALALPPQQGIIDTSAPTLMATPHGV